MTDGQPKNLERMQWEIDALSERIKKMESVFVTRAEFNALVKDFEKLESECVMQTEFKPIRLLVYGFVGTALASIFGLFATLLGRGGS